MNFASVSAWFHNSATIAWARLLMAAGALIDVLDQAASFFQASGLHSLLPDKYVGTATVAIGVITEVARRRTVHRQYDDCHQGCEEQKRAAEHGEPTQ